MNENQKLASAEDDDDENSDSKGHEDDENVRDEVHLIECLEDSVILDDQWVQQYHLKGVALQNSGIKQYTWNDVAIDAALA